jgi:translocation and assembly module TamB
LSSRYFAEKSSEFISNYINKKIEGEVEFQGIEFSLFPPGLRIKNISLDIEKIPGANIGKTKGQVGELKVDFSVFTNISKKLKITNIEINDGYLSIGTKNEEKKKKPKIKTSNKDFKKDINKKIKNIFRVINDQPVEIKRIAINTFNFNSDELDTFVTKLWVEKYRSEYQIESEFKYIKHLELKNSLGVDFINSAISVNISEQKIDIKKIRIEHRFNTLVTAGNIEFLEQGVKGAIKTNIDVNFEDLKKLKVVRDKLGLAHIEKTSIKEISIKIQNQIESKDQLNTVLSVNMGQLKYGTISLYSLEAKLKQQNENILIDNITLRDSDGGVIKVDEEIVVWEKGSFAQQFRTNVNFSNFDLNDIYTDNHIGLKFYGKTYGAVTVDISEKKNIDISFRNDFYFKNFAYGKRFDDYIARFSKLGLRQSNLLFGDNREVKFEGELLLNEIITIPLSLVISKEINLVTKKFKMNFNEILPISGQKIRGVGDLQIKGLFGKNESYLDLFLDLKNAFYDNIFLGNTKGNVKVDFANEKVDINGLNTLILTSTFTTSGLVSWGERRIDLGTKIRNLKSSEVGMIFQEYISEKFKEYIEGISGNFSIDNKIVGRFDEGISIQGKVICRRGIFFREMIDALSIEYQIKNKLLRIPGFKIKKGEGIISANGFFDLVKKYYQYELSVKNLSTQNINYFTRKNLGLTSKVNIKSKGRKNDSIDELEFLLRLNDSKISSTSLAESVLKIEKSGSQIKGNLNIFDKMLILESLIDLNTVEGQNNSWMRSNINISNWALLFNFFSNYDLNDPLLAGQFKAEINSDFNINQMESIDLDMRLNRLDFLHPTLKYQISNNHNQLLISDGNIKKSKIKIVGDRNEQLVLALNGSLRDHFYQSFVGSLKLEKLSQVINLPGKSKGLVEIKQNYFSNTDRKENKVSITGEDLLFDFKNNIFLRNIKLNSSYDSKSRTIKINQFNGVSGKGFFNVSGVIGTGKKEPDFNLGVNFVNTEFNLASKSFARFTGDLKLVGSERPYSLSGVININEVNIFNEVNDFDFGGDGGAESIRFLPSEKKKQVKSFLNTNISWKTLSPIRVKNSIVDISAETNGNIRGPQDDLTIDARLLLDKKRKSSINFKDNIFNIDALKIEFNNTKELNNPFVEFSAKSKIGKYLVKASVVGEAQSINIDLASDPYLKKEDILGLIALGYSEDINENLTDQEKDELMSSVGVGSLLFNQLGINEKLKKGIGVQLNLGAEVLEDESSYLSGRSTVGTGGVGRVRTATKVELKKDFNEKTNMSVSSTVSGNIGQKQSMNINYRVRENVSLEGVYEVNSGEENNETREDTSAGADLKFRWTFE